MMRAEHITYLVQGLSAILAILSLWRMSESIQAGTYYYVVYAVLFIANVGLFFIQGVIRQCLRRL